MSFETEHPNVHYLTGELVDAIVGIKAALSDGKIDPKEIADVLNSIDPKLRGVADYIVRLLEALKGLYPEVADLASLGPFRMMMEVAPYFANRLMRIFQ